MAVDLYASDPSFSHASGQQARDLDQLIAWTREQLGLGDDQPWRVVSSGMKLRKTLFEVEDSSGRRLFGKVSRSERASGTWARMRLLWEAGFRPPSSCRIPEPIAWLPERHLLLQERAPGQQLLEIVNQQPERASEVVPRAGAWLDALRSASLQQLEPAPSLQPVLERVRRELTEAVPELATRISRIADGVEGITDNAGISLLPSHGDYHPMNIYVTADGVVTAIDLDTVALNDPALDVAWFVAQTAIMSYHVHGNFENSAGVRRAFLDVSAEDPNRIAMHVRLALLRSLHYDLCILKLRQAPHLEPFLKAAESGALF